MLLGKDKGDKYVVTTLLIPKQHSTSDTCTMDEEELVMQFTEERHLITLGWVSDVTYRTSISVKLILSAPFQIHTHPTQSCTFIVLFVYALWLIFLRPGFMSSVDLHTHSGFQQMLPESFAVVCAPSSTPS